MTSWAEKTATQSQSLPLHALASSAPAKAALAKMEQEGVQKLTVTSENIDRYLPLLERAYNDGYLNIFTEPSEQEPFQRWVDDIRAGKDVDNVRVITLFGRDLDAPNAELISVAASELYRLDDGSMCMFPNYYFSMERAQREGVEKDARSEINPPIPTMFLAQLGDAANMAESEGKTISSLFFEAEDPRKTAEAGMEGPEQRMIMARNRMYEGMLRGLNVPHFKIADYVQHPLEEGAEPCTVLTGRFVGAAQQARSFIDKYQGAFTGKNLDQNAAAEPEIYGAMREGLDRMIAQGLHSQPATFDPSKIDISRITGERVRA